MGTPDLTLQPGDILRATVENVDDALDACHVNAGSNGRLLVPLEGLADAAVARLVPGASVCVQVLSASRGGSPARASASIEFSGRTSVLVLDGTAIAGGEPPAKPTVFVSKRLSGTRRAQLATKLEAALSDESCGLPAMLGTVSGPVTVILHSAADDTPWDKVLSGVVVQATEAAAFSVIAQVDSSPALLMSEKPDADGDAVVAASAAAVYRGSGNVLDGRRIVLDCGAQVVFEKTAALWTAAVQIPAAAGCGAAQANEEAARAVGEAIDECDVKGRVAVAFAVPADVESLVAVLATSARVDVSRISGDAAHSVAVLEA